MTTCHDQIRRKKAARRSGDGAINVTGNEGKPCILYDRTCGLCQRGERVLGNMMRRRGFTFAPLAGDFGRFAARDGVDEMKVITADGRVIGGAAAIAYLCTFVWWATPIAWLWRIPAARPPLCWLYRRIAANRHCADGLCRLRPKEPKWDFDRWF